jgi:hypothetical protein
MLDLTKFPHLADARPYNSVCLPRSLYSNHQLYARLRSNPELFPDSGRAGRGRRLTTPRSVRNLDSAPGKHAETKRAIAANLDICLKPIQPCHSQLSIAEICMIRYTGGTSCGTSHHLVNEEGVRPKR